MTMRKNKSEKYSVIKYKGLEEKMSLLGFFFTKIVSFFDVYEKNIYKKYRIIYNVVINY